MLSLSYKYTGLFQVKGCHARVGIGAAKVFSILGFSSLQAVGTDSRLLGSFSRRRRRQDDVSARVPFLAPTLHKYTRSLLCVIV